MLTLLFFCSRTCCGWTVYHVQTASPSKYIIPHFPPLPLLQADTTPHCWSIPASEFLVTLYRPPGMIFLSTSVICKTAPSMKPSLTTPAHLSFPFSYQPASDTKYLMSSDGVCGVGHGSG